MKDIGARQILHASAFFILHGYACQPAGRSVTLQITDLSLCCFALGVLLGSELLTIDPRRDQKHCCECGNALLIFSAVYSLTLQRILIKEEYVI